VSGLLERKYGGECDELADVEEEREGVSESLVLTSALDDVRARARRER